MSAQQSFVDQLKWCIKTQDYLNDLNSELKQVSKEYKKSVDNLKAFGYIKELTPHLESLKDEFAHSIDKIVIYIESEHIEYVYTRSKTIQGVLSDKFKGNK